MILLGAVGVSLVVALLFGGKLGQLAQLELRCGWLALASVALQLVIIYADLPVQWGALDLHLALVLAAYLPLVMMVLLNRQLPGMGLLGAGMVTNLTAMVANGGWMPISAETLARAGLGHLATRSEHGVIVAGSKDIVIAHADANLWFLGDVFVIPALHAAFSIGDICLAVGAFWFFWRVTRPGPKLAIVRS